VDDLSDIDLVVLRTKEIERRVTLELGARGRNLHEKVDSLARMLPSDFVHRVRRISAVRNHIVFEPGSDRLQNRQRFIDDCVAVESSITALKGRRLDLGRPSAGCFVATAVYGDYDCTEVYVFRRLRDEVFARKAIGRATIQLYYRISPTLAAAIQDSQRARATLRALLDPLASFCTRHILESQHKQDRDEDVDR